MTAENCRTEYWHEEDLKKPESILGRIKAYFKSLRAWLTSLVALLRSLRG